MAEGGDSKIYSIVNGIRVPYFVVQEKVDKLKDLKLYSDDLWVATYPKSGTMYYMDTANTEARGKQNDIKISDAVPWLKLKGSSL